MASIERARDPEVVVAALALPATLQKPPFNIGIFPLIRPPFMAVDDFPLVYRVTLVGEAGKAVAGRAARGGLLWTQCGNADVILGASLAHLSAPNRQPHAAWYGLLRRVSTRIAC